jgi:ketosteroid isomerase-like protein
VSQDSVELVLRGYRAFLAGDLDAIAELLDPEVEWHGIGEGAPAAADLEEVFTVLEERLGEGYRVELDRCIGLDDQVVVNFRAARDLRDPHDERPLQSRRYFEIGRYSGVVTIRDGRVVRVQDYPHLNAALEAVGLPDAAS